MSVDDLKTSVDSNTRKLAPDIFECMLCGYRANKRQRIAYHIEAKHTSGTNMYKCEYCKKVCPTKNALCVHKSRYHRTNVDFSQQQFPSSDQDFLPATSSPDNTETVIP